MGTEKAAAANKLTTGPRDKAAEPKENTAEPKETQEWRIAHLAWACILRRVPLRVNNPVNGCLTPVVIAPARQPPPVQPPCLWPPRAQLWEPPLPEPSRAAPFWES